MYWAGLNQNTRYLVKCSKFVFLERMPKPSRRPGSSLLQLNKFKTMQIKHIKQFIHGLPAACQAGDNMIISTTKVYFAGCGF